MQDYSDIPCWVSIINKPITMFSALQCKDNGKRKTVICKRDNLTMTFHSVHECLQITHWSKRAFYTGIVDGWIISTINETDKK